MPSLTDRIISSALWAAYGDALGFIAEGADSRNLKRRLGGRQPATVAWRRRVGWQGPDVDLPAGAYSDDTQLRLATARSIRSNGTFDPEPFSRVELPVWPSYALGAGKGSLDAARRLATGKHYWKQLVSGDRSGRYVNGGGNGAAMRVQPIAWVARVREDMIRDVILNTATTHGHPKAFVGALFHAELLRVTIREGKIPSKAAAHEIAVSLRDLSSDVNRHLGNNWQETWSAATAQTFAAVWDEASAEITTMLADVEGPQKKPASAYKAMLEAHNLLTDAERGSATKTAAAAYIALLLYADADTDRIIRDIAMLLGSDTDSIATMAGALLGGSRAERMPHPVQDHEYLVASARRMAAIASGQPPERDWHYKERDYRISPARVIWETTSARLLGIGTADPIGSPVQRRADSDAYQWHRLWFGQTILLRVPAQRARLSLDSDVGGLFTTVNNAVPMERGVVHVREGAEHEPPAPAATDTRQDTDEPPLRSSEPDPDEVAKRLARGGFDPTRIGRTILSAARRPYGEALAGAIAYAVARLARLEEERSRASVPVQPPKPTLPPQTPKPEIQLQLRAKPDEKGTTVEGAISNYGRADALDVRIQLGLHESPALRFDRLTIQERHNVSFESPLPVVRGMPVAVVFQNGDGRYRQEGTFEAAAGVADTLLLKGLGDLKPAR